MGSDARPGSLRRDWMTTTGTSVLIGLIVFVAAPVAANRLGPEGRRNARDGPAPATDTRHAGPRGPGFLDNPLRLPQAGSLRTLWRWSLSRCALGSVVTVAFGWFVAPLITSSAADERMLRVYLVICPLSAFTFVPLEMLRALGRYGMWNSFTFLYRVVWPIALLIGVLQAEPSLWLVVWLHLAASALVLLVLALYCARVTSEALEEPTTDRGEYLRYGLKSALSTVPGSANARLDQIIMAGLVSTSDLGLYAAAVGWSQISQPVMRGLIAVTMPFVSGAHDHERAARVRRLTTLGAATVAVLAVLGVAATLVLWGPLYGDAFASALPAALVLVVAALVLQYNVMLGNVLRSLDRPGLVTWIEAAVLAGSVLGLLAVLTVSTVLGPAVVSLATYVTAGAAYALIIARRTDQRPRELIDLGGALQMAAQIRRRFGRRGAAAGDRG
ncbi:MAG: oligosaccharide flippase family protein [Microthrixaceae bacterium]